MKGSLKNLLLPNKATTVVAQHSWTENIKAPFSLLD